MRRQGLEPRTRGLRVCFFVRFFQLSCYQAMIMFRELPFCAVADIRAALRIPGGAGASRGVRTSREQTSIYIGLDQYCQGCLGHGGEGPSPRGRPIWAPDRLPRLDVAHALAVVELPLRLNWSAPGRVFDLRSRADRAPVYETVLQEGRPADILAYVDGALLADLWDELVLPRAVRFAWAPLVASSGRAA